MKLKASYKFNDDTNRIWREYHKQLTGSDFVGYGSNGNLYEAIAKHNPGFQSEILYIMFEEGYKKAMLELKRS
ncbi:hypothetical protein [Tissierella praeacuta]|uniref:hypothetical protein n=1 Tax=Tissierella praeacuta TaxID=43131 RepID=UPI002FD8C290